MKKILLFGLLACGVGCASVGRVGISEQRLVSKPHMQFSQSGVYVIEDDQDWGSSGINDIENEANANKN